MLAVLNVHAVLRPGQRLSSRPTGPRTRWRAVFAGHASVAAGRPRDHRTAKRRLPRAAPHGHGCSARRQLEDAAGAISSAGRGLHPRADERHPHAVREPSAASTRTSPPVMLVTGAGRRRYLLDARSTPAEGRASSAMKCVTGLLMFDEGKRQFARLASGSAAPVVGHPAEDEESTGQGPGLGRPAAGVGQKAREGRVPARATTAPRSAAIRWRCARPSRRSS